MNKSKRFIMIFFLIISNMSCKKNVPENLLSLPAITTGEVYNISDVTAFCGSTLLSDGNSMIIKCGLCFSTDSNKLNIESAYYTTDNFKNDSFTRILTHLIPNTKYFIKSYAVNQIGTSYGKTISFTTKFYTSNINFNPTIEYGNLEDQDGNIYKTVNIGNQVWMAENLKVITYSSGDTLTYGRDYNWYNNERDTYKSSYGALYDWTAVNTGKLCPIGWHVPSESDWRTLGLSLNPLGPINKYPLICTGGGKLKETGITHWHSPNTGATNSFGFTAIPSGCYAPSGFSSSGLLTYYWSSTRYYKPPTGGTTGLDCTPDVRIYFDSENFNMNCGYYVFKSVRCVKD